jgi:hypothetical protein
LTSEGQDAWQRWQDAEQGVQQLHQARKDSLEAVAVAQSALDAEIEKSAETGTPGQEVKLTVKLNACLENANPEIHDRRIKRAESLAYTAQQNYEQHLANNLDLYLEALEPLANEVAAQIADANAEYEQKIGPLQTQHAALQAATAAVLGRSAGFVPEDIPSDFNEPPFPHLALARRDGELKAAEQEREAVPAGGVGWIEKPVSEDTASVW